jgi:hypothetical protein
MKLRRGMISEDGPGWAVTGYDGEPLPGRWPTKEAAEVNGYLGVYLMSGVDLMCIPEQPVETSRGGWTYKGWSFHKAVAWPIEYKIHGPNSTGARARKIVRSYQDAVRYIDRHTAPEGS